MHLTEEQTILFKKLREWYFETQYIYGGIAGIDVVDLDRLFYYLNDEELSIMPKELHLFGKRLPFSQVIMILNHPIWEQNSLAKEKDPEPQTKDIGNYAIVVEGKSAFTKTYSKFELKELEDEARRLAKNNKGKVFIVEIRGVLEQQTSVCRRPFWTTTLFGEKVEFNV